MKRKKASLGEITFWKGNKTDSPYTVPVVQLVDEFFAYAEKRGGLRFGIMMMVGVFMGERSSGRDTWEPVDTNRLTECVHNDPRYRENARWIDGGK